MSGAFSSPIGPILMLDGIGPEVLHLSALFIAAPGTTLPPVEPACGGQAVPAVLARHEAATVWRARFALPADRPSSYRWNGTCHDIACDLTGDLRLAYVSCNGEEIGDMDRPGAERNIMWDRLCSHHRDRPFALMLHGGDQVYADELTRDHPLSRDWPAQVPDTPDPAALHDLRRHLRRGFLDRYAALYRAPQFAWLAARVPSLMQWDDHDICDGWGSLDGRLAGSAVGRTLFEVARESFLVFQQAGAPGDLPPRMADPQGRHLGWCVATRGLRILAPDLRSERTRQRIMGPGGWAMMTAAARDTAPGHSLLMSSVPLLGPRLSLLERLIPLVPPLRKYEDDLRDQWQSRAHRDEWRRMLRLVADLARHEGHAITALSGEIHLATRAEMELGPGRRLDQLVASGIAHRAPPRGWARFLGALSALGEDPLPAHPIRIRPLPGQPHRYVAERNALVLERRGGRWQAQWDLEHSGMTPPLPL